MPVDPELLELMTDILVQEPYLETDFDNVEQFDDPIEHCCHISAHSEEILRSTGVTAVQSHRIVLADRASFDVRDKITIPARFNNTTPEILAVLEFTEIDPLNPQHHTTLLVGRNTRGVQA